MIPVEHARAKDIADVLKDLYADRLVAAQNQAQQGGRGGFFRAMMGGMGGGPFGGGPGGPFGGGAPGGGQGGQNQRDNANRIAIGVDARTNTLVVSATDSMFEEVKQLVHQLDLAAASQTETVRVITLHRTSATAVGKVLTAVAGDAVQTSSSTANSSAANNNANSSPAPWWANRGAGGSPGGQSSFSPGGQPGGFSPFGSGGGGYGRRSRYFGSGGPGQ
jgi:hypothetical protein